jgi:hypothetical protein
MTPDQFRAALARLGLTQAGAAALVGADPRTARRWAKLGPPQYMAAILRLLIAKKITVGDVEAANR